MNPSESDLTVPVVVSVVLIALVAISVAAFFIWRKKKGDRADMSKETKHEQMKDLAKERVR